MSKNEILITKASGDVAVFSQEKVEKSLRRSGAHPALARKVAEKVASSIASGMSTQDIYELAFSLLKEEERPVAARYSLKKAITAFGPTGFPFEKFMGEIFSRKGFETKIGVVVEGGCVSHEVDVVAQNKQKHYFMECKFHSSQAIATDVKVALYVHSRFLDIIARIEEQGSCHVIHKAWVITNTRLTGDAIKYGECAGMKVIGWKYPKGRGVEVLIEETGLHPVTCLTSINDKEKKGLLENDIVLCQDIPKRIDFLKSLGIDDERLEILLEEVRGVCGE